MFEDRPRGEKIINILPASWNYTEFFEELENETSEAVSIFNKEAELICKEQREMAG